MASLNAEAVNNLLFKKDPKSSRKTQHPKNKNTETEPNDQTSKTNPQTQDMSATQDQSTDWMSIFAPTPRRQAGIAAASLLKLTSAQCRKWQRKGNTHDTKRTPQKHKYQRAERRRGPHRCSAQTGRSECSLKNDAQIQKVENHRAPSYCCSQEQCVQCCHRLALFHPGKSCQGPDNVFHHHHHHLHHHHHHLTTLSPNSYTCFPAYYFHLCHPSVTTQEVGTSSRKSSGALGISHPVYCCNPSTISYQSCSGMTPAICHVCCSQCMHRVKKEEFHPAVSDIPSPSPLMCPRALTACPTPQVPPPALSSQTRPPAVPLPLDHICPQSTQTSRALHTGPIRDRSHTPSVVSVARKRHQRSTNGWKPVGQSYQKEVFTAGEETPVWRTCFEAVQRDEEVVQVRDTVLLKSGSRKKSLPYVAKVSALWEDPDSGELMMSLFWYYRPEHTQGGRRPNVHCENEVFASRHQDVNSVACIEDKCYVLTLAQYCRFRALLKRQREGVGFGAASVVPPALQHSLHSLPPALDPQLVFYCGHVYDYRYGRLLKNLQ
uniref:BAH domain-containing protein n=1 Tax=Knipowitschia caucasica TaxID=637954 RepID=A0AAV2JBY5_KNICA